VKEVAEKVLVTKVIFAVFLLPFNLLPRSFQSKHFSDIYIYIYIVDFFLLLYIPIISIDIEYLQFVFLII